MSEAELPERAASEHVVTIDDVRRLTAAATPHFAQQVRARIAKLILPLTADDPARVAGERAMAELVALGRDGEHGGAPTDERLPPMPSLGAV